MVARLNYMPTGVNLLSKKCNLFGRQQDVRTDDEHPMITKAHLEPMAQVS